MLRQAVRHGQLDEINAELTALRGRERPLEYYDDDDDDYGPTYAEILGPPMP